MICTLLRKPLFGNTLGSLPCGVLHIDASRVTTSDNLNGGAYVGSVPRHDGTENWRYKRGLSGEFVPPSGRFPANLIMTHLMGCQWLGTVKVKGTRTDTRPDGDGGRKDRTEYRIRPTDQTKRGYSEPDGKETVDSWQCVDGCSVKGLDNQSGERRSTMTGRAPAGGVYINPGKSDPNVSMFGVGGGGGGVYADSGGASRFFKQVAQ